MPLPIPTQRRHTAQHVRFQIRHIQSVFQSLGGLFTLDVLNSPLVHAVAKQRRSARGGTPSRAIRRTAFAKLLRSP